MTIAEKIAFLAWLIDAHGCHKRDALGSGAGLLF
jgi:hypothetical protein